MEWAQFKSPHLADSFLFWVIKSASGTELEGRRLFFPKLPAIQLLEAELAKRKQSVALSIDEDSTA
ncbi:MAG: hypothetical protein WCA21_05785 [Terracidiphilus sp.]